MTAASADRVEPALAVHDIWKSFGSTQALRGVSLEVRPGTVHGLLGRNGAGKSTLVGAIMGDLGIDRGEISLDEDGSAAGVAAVYQQLKLVPHLSVAENLQLGNYKKRWIRWKEFRQGAKAVLDEWNLPLELNQPVVELRLDQQQLITIVRALMSGARVILLDEPTSRLNARETQDLFGHVRALTKRGISFLFISHSLSELKELSDDLTILRDGAVVASGPAANFTAEELVAKLSPTQNPERSADLQAGVASSEIRVGREFGEDLAVKVERLTAGSELRGVRFEVRQGEWLGLTGLVGSGAVQLACLIAGFGPKASSGSVEVFGQRIGGGQVAKAQSAGVGFVPPDRHGNGLVPTMSVTENLTLAAIDHLSSAGFLRGRERRRIATRQVEAFGVVVGDIDDPITSLSGGNQQKVLIARAFALDPRLAVITNPTVGVDIGSKEVIYGSMRRAQKAGCTGIIASEDELEDLKLCDRVLVFREGEVITELGPDRDADDLFRAIEGIGEERVMPAEAPERGGSQGAAS